MEWCGEPESPWLSQRTRTKKKRRNKNWEIFDSECYKLIKYETMFFIFPILFPPLLSFSFDVLGDKCRSGISLYKGLA